jgi:hypothetical protein
MKNATLAFAMLAVLSLSACANGGTWTPQGDGRTAGEGQVEATTGHNADSTFSGSLRK